MRRGRLSSLCVYLLSLWSIYVVTTTLLLPGLFNYPAKCWCSDENFCIPRFMPLHPVLQSKYFDCNLFSFIRDFKLRDTDKWIDQETIKWTSDLNIVTASSSNHFNLSRGLLKHLRSVHLENQIVFYDLGLTIDQQKEVQRLCNVIYRRFPFERYPQHVSELMNFSWKVLILAEELKQNRTFLYLDASVRFTELYRLDRILEMVRRYEIEPYTPLRNVEHSIYAATAPGFYKYIPLPKTISQMYRVDSAAAQLVVPVDYTREIMKWSVLCALTSDCIAPPGHSVECVFNSKDTYTKYQHCHRYDQTLFCALTARKLLGYEHYAYRYNYTFYPYAQSSIDNVRNVLEVRKDRYYQVAQMLRLDRNDLINSTLIQKCTMEQELLKAWHSI
ncbi:hypothetical protein M3Y95_00429000 [Aphelenchoides besseyi]|nr:hypothetical protein M3Y95_00429000 [Aphelenchoides besseyi]